MDWKIASSAFAAIFIAELGDKTQLAAVTMAASTGRPLSVLAGAGAALIAVTALGVFAGEALLRAVPEAVLRRCAAVLFVAMGLWTWFKS